MIARGTLRGSNGILSTIRGFAAVVPGSSSSSSSSNSKARGSGGKSTGAVGPVDSTSIRLKDWPSSIKVTPLVANTLSLATASQKEITIHKISLAMLKFQGHATDCGSAAVQIAVATEKIHNMVRHTAVHKKDRHSNRGFQMMVARRKKMMKYLKNTDLQRFKEVVAQLGLEREASNVH